MTDPQGTRFGQKVQIKPATQAKASLASHIALWAFAGILSLTGVWQSGGKSTADVVQCTSGTCAVLVQEVVECTATGGQVKYPYCNWVAPENLAASSGSLLRRIDLQFGDSPVGVSIDLTANGDATSSGSSLLQNNILSSSGGTATWYSASGSAVVPRVAAGKYVRAIATSNPSSSHTARMIIEYMSIINRE